MIIATVELVKTGHTKTGTHYIRLKFRNNLIATHSEKYENIFHARRIGKEIAKQLKCTFVEVER